jgi:DNA-binding NtrC family response regulator
VTAISSSSSSIAGSHVVPNIRQDLVCAIRCDARVLISGGGLGARSVAKLIHRNSQRSRRRFLTLECEGASDVFLESRLFGRAHASAGGDNRDTRGFLEQADGGTIFIGNIGAIGAALQARLLHFLEHGAIRRVGADVAHTRVDVRVITSAERSLFEQTELRTFREDLYYRLNVLHLVLPPTQAHLDDRQLAPSR